MLWILITLLLIFVVGSNYASFSNFLKRYKRVLFFSIIGAMLLFLSLRSFQLASLVGGIIFIITLIDRLRKTFFLLYQIYRMKTWMKSRFHPGTSPHSPLSSSLSLEEARSLLGVSNTASRKEINHAYYQKMRKHHPDRGGDLKEAIRINQARDMLLNALKQGSS